MSFTTSGRTSSTNPSPSIDANNIADSESTVGSQTLDEKIHCATRRLLSPLNPPALFPSVLVL